MGQRAKNSGEDRYAEHGINVAGFVLQIKFAGFK